ncbi:undecaprenyl-diphosphate phosphatase [Fredinandcohnia quinoae]|uniref:Undecaprenyl-diphosphatase n=1 Tax=Fredinandcohnia quinoae TaxID=2918902 RepID=A0AAW5E076_9BACI|nr:undecaprenyl-diphosphate phosphatase [Fredinandcohnia sp. SECRCQ15]MCH1626310.1 undecaprenyl-diphosphate phosphatase [Fredinandcohnia sp. SECRCQ15]
MELLTIIKAIILGMVEGLTEFAPVSSTGHMIIVDDIWLHSEKFLGSKYVANTFMVMIQLGSILAVVVVFKDRFIDLLGLRRNKIVPVGKKRLKLTHIIVGLLPAGVLGVLFEDTIDEYLFDTKYVLIGLVVGAILMIIADRYSAKNDHAQAVDEITYKQAFTVGLIQCFSLWPGFSRSGATISGGVLVGLSHRAAADFTFIMAVPIMAGASGISFIKNLEYFTMDALPFFIAGFISAFVFALICIRFFLKLIDKVKLLPFAIYRILLAVIIYIVYF